MKSLIPAARAGDGSPLDICVTSERPIQNSEIILKARVVRVLPMLDNEEADHKIVAARENDNMWHDVQDVSDLPDVMVERLRHYFSTYKILIPEDHKVKIVEAHGREEAAELIDAAIADYLEQFGDKRRPKLTG